MNCAHGSLVLDTPPAFFLHNSPDPIIGETVPDSSSTLFGLDSTVSGNSYDDGGTNNPPDLEALIQTPLQLGETLIIYHPHAQNPPEIVDTTTLLHMREPQPSLLCLEPWVPFSSRDDFKQAELFIKHNCTNQLINDQLSLNKKQDLHHHHPAESPSMKNA